MKKVFSYLIILTLIFTLTGCGEEPIPEKKWPEQTYFDDLPVPAEKIDKFLKDTKNEEYSEYSVYVNDYDYTKFHKYITELESMGFKYEFFTTSVPSDVNKLTDKTETSWGANNGVIWIRALWRSSENTYYNGYNLQLIINNYDYMNPVPEAKKQTIEPEKNETSFFFTLF